LRFKKKIIPLLPGCFQIQVSHFPCSLSNKIHVKPLLNAEHFRKLHAKQYLQNTFSFHESSSTAASMKALTALHVSVFPWSARVGVKVRVEKVIFSSDDTYKQAKQATLYLQPCNFSVISG